MVSSLIPVQFTERDLEDELEILLAETGAGRNSSAHSLNARFLVDDSAADNGSKRTQADWLTYWSGVRDGRVMASMGDLYSYFQQLKRESDHGQKAQVKAALDSLHDDFDWPGKNNWLIGGTRHIYIPTTESTRIIHHYNCSRRELTTQVNLAVPVYLGTVITEVVRDTNGLKYLQAEFATTDDGTGIMDTLEFISGKRKNKIKVWTPPIEEGIGYATRKAVAERAAGFNYGDGGFHVVGSGIISLGRSRGVKVGPR